jgi:hypothetical protein
LAGVVAHVGFGFFCVLVVLLCVVCCVLYSIE